MLENDRKLFIYNFGRDAAEGEVAGDEVDGATMNYDIPDHPMDQHCNNLEVALQTIQGLAQIQCIHGPLVDRSPHAYSSRDSLGVGRLSPGIRIV